MNRLNRSWFVLSFIVALVAAAVNVWGYRYLPEQIPLHWNIAGEVDRYGSRHMQILLGLLPLGVTLLMAWLPKIDPKFESYEKHARAYGIFALLIVTTISVMTVVALLAGMGRQVNIPQVMSWSLGLLFIFMGNFMSQIRPSWFVGIRTPWTLASEETWRKTHRFGGVVYIIMGLVILISGFLKPQWSFYLVMTALVGGTVLPAVYSYLDYRKRVNR
ncbi:SdpI family protein [Staphylospora marina]|uniref:SdpI family protein n=1 Tax=Staphylospora marina TaxID=2490858 RepID=UPI000F5BBDC9|nr:SdpI family protein [Staphylospora marina]